MNLEIIPKKDSFLPDNSDYVVKQRRKWVLEQYLLCRMPSEIYDEWTQKYPGLSGKSYDVDVTHVYKELNNAIGTNEEIIDKHIRLYYDIYAKQKDDNPKLAMEALKNIERLKRLGGPNVAVQINNNVGTSSFENYSVEDLKNLLDNPSE